MALYKTGERSLEKYKFFPYLAWILVFAFAFFVYKVVLDLQETASRIENSGRYSTYNVDASLRSPDKEKEESR